jgi:hypothetical protein
LSKGTTFELKYLHEFETDFEKILGMNLGSIWGQFMKKIGSHPELRIGTRK